MNADGYVNANGDIIGFNMYAYCGNNPVRFMDPGGEWIIEIIVACVLVVGALTMSSCSSESTPTVPQDDGVYYDVPCYKQGLTDLCGLYCQVMIEDYYDMNTIRTQKQVNSRVRELQTQIYGTYDPSRSTNPTNMGTALPIENIETLGQYLSNGPIYAQYTSSIGPHMVVVCGVDTRNNIVYTCNPWGIKSSQTYAEFISGPTRNWYIPSEDWSLYCYYDVKR